MTSGASTLKMICELALKAPAASIHVSNIFFIVLSVLIPKVTKIKAWAEFLSKKAAFNVLKNVISALKGVLYGVFGI